MVKEEYWPWFAQYMVMKRASIEPNFHTLYANFLDTVKIGELSKLVLRETFRNIKVNVRHPFTYLKLGELYGSSLLFVVCLCGFLFTGFIDQ